MPFTAPPTAAEHDPYYKGYIDLVPPGHVLDLLEHQLGDTVHLMSGIAEEQAEHRHAPGKWSIKEVLGHVVDCERVFAFRALAFARGDAGPLPGFDQDAYVANAGFGARTLRSVVGELVHVRRGNIHMFRAMDAGAAMRTGTANGASVSVRALAFIIAGHERHHVGQLRRLYL